MCGFFVLTINYKRAYCLFQCYVHHLSVWFVFFVTLTCFPAIQANIKSSGTFNMNGE